MKDDCTVSGCRGRRVVEVGVDRVFEEGCEAYVGSSWGATALAGALAAVTVLLAAGIGAAAVVTGELWLTFPADYRIFNFVVAIVFSVAGVAIVRRQPRSAIGWFYLAAAIGNGLAGLGTSYVLLDEHLGQGTLPGDAIVLGLIDSAWVPLGGAVGITLAVFPDGRPLSSRWRLVPYAIGAGTALSLIGGSMSPFDPSRLPPAFAGVANPLATPLGPPLANSGLCVAAAGALAAAVSLFLRVRRARGTERKQLRWLVLAMPPFLLSFAGLFFVAGASVLISSLAVTLFAAPIVLAIVRYQLYGVVVSSAFVFGTLAALITGVYVAVVVGLGHAIRAPGSDLGLSILATAIVAVAFQPAREGMQRLANRLVYGHRDTPYEVLSRFPERVAGAYAGADALPRMAMVLAQGTGASAATVWIRSGGDMRPVASWPAGTVVEAAAAGWRAPVGFRGEELGELALGTPPGDPLTPVEERLLTDLSVQAGIVLHNVRLFEEVRARLEEISARAAELRESRQRIVAAQDRERRRLERDIHDGAQQHLVALVVKLGLVAMLAERDRDRALAMLQELEHETAEAQRTLHELARGIYPPVLRERGLVAALEAGVAHMPVPVRVIAEELERTRPEVEGAVYFTCLEALQNVAKHAHATHAQVLLAQDAGELRFSVTDDGVGFDPSVAERGSGLRNMADRVAAVGGSLHATTRAGEGAIVTGAVPLQAAEVGR